MCYEGSYVLCENRSEYLLYLFREDLLQMFCFAANPLWFPLLSLYTQDDTAQVYPHYRTSARVNLDLFLILPQRWTSLYYLTLGCTK